MACKTGLARGVLSSQQSRMLSHIRRIARSLGLFAVLVFIAPGVVVDCREISAMGAGLMSCCKPSDDGAGLKADCCVAGVETSAPERPSSTTASARPAADALAVTTAALPPAGLAVMPALGVIDLLDTGPPLDRLYILYAVIRR